MKGWLGRLGRLKDPVQMADWYERIVFRLFPVWKRFPLLTFPEPAIKRFEHLRSQRLNIAVMDLRIAAVALENTLTVVTRNIRDFGRVPGVPTVDWSI
jgi:tRNA(fMet)-specific endonuclease VapC